MAEKEKIKISIEVEPTTATMALGLVRGFMPAIFQHMRQTANELPERIIIADGFEGEIMEVLDEIYNKCISETPIREKAAELLEILELTGRFPDNIEN